MRWNHRGLRSRSLDGFDMNAPLPRWKRILLGLALPAAGALLLWYMHLGGVGLKCPVYELTGLYCPGCGSGRAVYSALHGRFAESFRYNPALYIIGIPAAIVFLHEYLRVVFPRLDLRPVYIPRGLALAAALAILVWMIVRNLPVCSFLAPAG